jgi:virginiamycin B lyase
MERIAVIVIVLAFATVAMLGCGGGDDESTTSVADTSSTTETSESAPAPERTNLKQAGATKITVDGDWLAAGEGAVWLSGRSEIHRLDPQSGRPVQTIPVPEGPCEATDVGFGSLWTATCKKPGLARIDPGSNRVLGEIPLDIPSSLDGEGSIGAGEGGVWLVIDGKGCKACRLAKVDAGSMTVAAQIPIQSGAAGVRVGEGSVWVTNPDQDLVQQVDPDAEDVVGTYPVDESPRFLAVGEGGVWTLNQVDGSITHLNPETGEEVATIPAEIVGGGGDMSSGDGWVWARGTYTLLSRIDPAKDRVVEQYEPSAGSGAVIVGFGAVWISAHDVSTVWRLPLDG